MNAKYAASHANNNSSNSRFTWRLCDAMRSLYKADRKIDALLFVLLCALFDILFV